MDLLNILDSRVAEISAIIKLPLGNSIISFALNNIVLDQTKLICSIFALLPMNVMLTQIKIPILRHMYSIITGMLFQYFIIRGGNFF
jgi:hypothetical protein